MYLKTAIINQNKNYNRKRVTFNNKMIKFLNKALTFNKKSKDLKSFNECIVKVSNNCKTVHCNLRLTCQNIESTKTNNF